MGRVVSDRPTIKVSYRHPVTHQRVRATLYTGESLKVGTFVRIVAENDDPMSIATERGLQQPRTANVPWYAAFLGLACLPLLFRRFQIRRAERLAGGDATSFAMRGALFRAHFGRAQLALYALDAPLGAAPVCSVRVLTTAMAPQGAVLFPVEVKGSPRPLGRVVAAFQDEVLWPAGPALTRRRAHPRPELPVSDLARVERIPNPQLAWRTTPWRLLAPALAVFGASLLLVAVVSAVTLRNAAASDRWFDQARRTVGTVVSKSGDDSFVMVSYNAGDENIHARARVIYDSDFTTGVKYPIRVDRANPSHVRLESEPYDRTGPISWALVPAVIVVPWLAHRLRAWFRIARAALRGPWYRVDAAYDGIGFLDASLIGLRAGGNVVAKLQVAPAGFPRDEPFPLIVAGAVDPSAAAAAWYDGVALSPAGLATVAEHRAFIDGDDHDDDDDDDDDDVARTVDLKSYPISWRKPRLDVGHRRAVITLPGYFSESWRITTSEIAAFDLGTVGPFSLPRVTTPYLDTTGMGQPTLLLLFREPIRIPPLRRFTSLGRNHGAPWTYRGSRSATGEFADGIMLRAVDAGLAVRVLAAAGAEAPPDPEAWLRDERPRLVAGVDWSWFRRWRRGQSRP